MKWLAVDYGDSRTGLAGCDAGETITSPITPQIEEKSMNKVAAAVTAVAQADRHQALFGPTAVTVHDDGDMGGEAGSSILRHGGFSPSIVCFVSDFGRLRTQHLGRLLIRVVGTPV